MNLFWIKKYGIKIIVYPNSYFNNLIFYTDSKDIIRCFEKESLKYLKSYNILLHPITMEPISTYLFNILKSINLQDIQNNKTKENGCLKQLYIGIVCYKLL